MGRRGGVVGILLLALVVTGCANGEAMTEDSPSFTATSLESPSSPAPATVSDARLAAIAADLATRDIDGALQVQSVENATWPNAGLGCPDPGVAYTQVQIDGQRVVVSAGGDTYDYRFGGDDTPRLCS